VISTAGYAGGGCPAEDESVDVILGGRGRQQITVQIKPLHAYLLIRNPLRNL